MRLQKGSSFEDTWRIEIRRGVLQYAVLAIVKRHDSGIHGYGSEKDSDKKEDRVQYYVIRLVAAFIVAILAAWVVSIITDGSIDFYFVVVVLMVFAVIEWFVRAQQSGEFK